MTRTTAPRRVRDGTIAATVVISALVVILIVAALVFDRSTLRKHRHRPLAAQPGTSASSPQPQASGSLGATSSLDHTQVAFLRDAAARTWRFFQADLDPTTHLPRNNVTPTGPSGHSDFTSPTEIGMFLGALVSAKDLQLADPSQLTTLAAQELATLQKLQTYRGFPLRWYQASTGAAIGGPTGKPLTDPFISTVDDAWYAQGLVLARQAFPSLATGYTVLLDAMNFSLLYNPNANQLYTGFHAHSATPDSSADTIAGTDPAASADGQPTAGDYKLLYGGTRIADYLAIGTKTVPGTLWWGLQQVPAGTSQRQQPVTTAVTVRDPQTGTVEHVTQGYYTYAGIKFVPTFAGSMFQALAPALVAPELAQSPAGLGLNDRNTVLAQIAYARQSLSWPVWGLAPASTPKRLNGYAQYGAAGLATKAGTIPQDAITPYAAALALSVEPQLAAQDLSTLATSFPGLYTEEGFLDSVDPTTGQVSGRYMAVSQAAILMGIDNGLTTGILTGYFAADPVGKTLAPYLQESVFPLS